MPTQNAITCLFFNIFSKKKILILVMNDGKVSNDFFIDWIIESSTLSDWLILLYLKIYTIYWLIEYFSPKTSLVLAWNTARAVISADFDLLVVTNLSITWVDITAKIHKIAYFARKNMCIFCLVRKKCSWLNLISIRPHLWRVYVLLCQYLEINFSRANASLW